VIVAEAFGFSALGCRDEVGDGLADFWGDAEEGAELDGGHAEIADHGEQF